MRASYLQQLIVRLPDPFAKRDPANGKDDGEYAQAVQDAEPPIVSNVGVGQLEH